MEIISDLSVKLDFPNPVVTIGNFDGVHLGHQKIFERVVEKAREIKGTPIAITFNPHPVRVLAPERGLKMINTIEDKRQLISRLGIKVLICIYFDRDFAHTEPDDFIRDILVEKLRAKWVIVGHNYAFGKGKKGTTDMLRAKGMRFGFNVNVVRYAEVNDDVVSSSRIRSLILRGRVCEASKMLGRAYHIDGTVITGAGRGGPLLNTPTANLHTVNELVPKEGVYAVRVSIAEDSRGQEFKSSREQLDPSTLRPLKSLPLILDGVANIGENPTFSDTKMNYEVHLFNFNRNIVGQKLRMHFIDRIRDEKKFSGIKELEEYIRKDIEKTKEILSGRKDPLFL